MARTQIPLTNLAKNGLVNAPAGTAVDVANGHYIDVGGLAGRLLLWINNTFAGTKVCTIKAGVNPPAYRKDIGDLAVTAPNAAAAYAGPFESARFVQAPGGTDGGAGGRIFLDLTAGMTGTIAALWLPDGV